MKEVETEKILIQDGVLCSTVFNILHNVIKKVKEKVLKSQVGHINIEFVCLSAFAANLINFVKNKKDL